MGFFWGVRKRKDGSIHSTEKLAEINFLESVPGGKVAVPESSLGFN